MYLKSGVKIISVYQSSTKAVLVSFFSEAVVVTVLITQYGSTVLPYSVYRDGSGLFCIIVIHSSFHFQFQFSLTSNNLKVENM